MSLSKSSKKWKEVENSAGADAVQSRKGEAESWEEIEILSENFEEIVPVWLSKIMNIKARTRG